MRLLCFLLMLCACADPAMLPVAAQNVEVPRVPRHSHRAVSMQRTYVLLVLVAFVAAGA